MTFSSRSVKARRMKTRISLIILLFILSGSAVKSQAPGYLGKTLIANFDVNFAPSIRTYGFDDYWPLKFNMKSGIGLDYVFSRNNTVGLKFNFFKTNFDFTEDCVFDTNILGSTYYDVNFRSNGLAQMKVRNLGINIKMFRHNLLAPLGMYSEFELNYYSYNISYSEDTLFLYAVKNQYDTKWIPEFPNGKFRAMGLNYTVGYQRIFFDKLVTNIGLQFGWLFTGDILIYEQPGYLELDPADYLRILSQRRLQYHTAINLEAGVGILLY